MFVPLEGKSQKTLAVKGLVNLLDQRPGEVTPGAEQLLEVLATQFTAGATWTDWYKASGLTNGAFKRYRKELENAKRITGGGGRDAKYCVAAQPKPAASERSNSTEEGSSTRVQASPYRGAGPLDPSQVGSMDPIWTQSGPEPNTEGCKNFDTTPSDKNEPESLSELDLVADAIKHLKTKPAKV